MNFKIVILFLGIFSSSVFAQNTEWPVFTSEMKPGSRWWWLGSAVDQANLTYNLESYASAGMGSVEITPIYGVQKNDANNIAFLSEDWMKMLKHTLRETKRLGMQTDMNTGTGWPFGGPEITEDLAASKLIIRKWQTEGGKILQELILPEDKSQKNASLLRVIAFQGNKVINLTKKVTSANQISWKVPAGNWEIIAAFNGKTFQKVKRAAPGGEGYVMDHLSQKAVKSYFSKFEQAFQSSGSPWPHHFFNDSYEVYGADWTVDFFEQFEKRRGYKLENHMPDFLSEKRTDITARLIADYRETISDLLLENFTQQWTSFAHKYGSKTRNQAHGSPGNLIDLYANVDVPECEGFGLSDFNIPGLRKDSLTRKNDSDLSMLKYASSAAHISGKPYTSSETFTWLTEHFRTSLSQCKPDLDLMFVSGVNHMNFHGTPYSPKEAQWPGWLFYASVNMSPTNTIWRDAPAMFQYITRCQSFLQTGMPNNDFLLYLPVYDAWYEQPGRFLQFSIHDMEKRMPEFIHAVHAIYENGFDVDYISERFILNTKVVDGKLITEGGVSYKALILPAVKILPLKVMKHLKKLAEQGATIVMLDRIPDDVPGFNQYLSAKKQLNSVKKMMKLPEIQDETQITKLGKGKFILSKNYKDALLKTGVQPEDMITRFGLHAIRRSNSDGHHYFISDLQEKQVDGWVKIAVPAQSALIFDPISGAVGKAKVRQQNGATEVYLQLKPGESRILKTFKSQDIQSPEWIYLNQEIENIRLINDWQLTFKESVPEVKDTFSLKKPVYWTDLNIQQLNILAGTGVYSSTFDLNKRQNCHYQLSLTDLRESARIYINGKEISTLWAVPFECLIDSFLQNGKNTIRIEVTNLPANRIADYDRKGVNWRIFNEINMVNIQYKKSDYSNWKVLDSGLSGEVIIWCFN